MLPYYKKYSIIACIIGVAPSVIISTLYPLMTGTIMAASIGGLVMLFVIFALSMMIGFNSMERRAEQVTNKLLALYNDDCDPQLFLTQGASVAQNVAFPCKEAGAWFMSYYAQALLDAGEVDRARAVEKGLQESAQVAKKPQLKAGIIVNLIPLADKLDGTKDALSLIHAGLTFIQNDPTPIASERRAFLESQQKIMEVRMSGDATAAAELDEAIRKSEAYPMRIRVEAAWAEARAYFKTSNVMGERSALHFVIDHGNKLALVSQAQQRLAGLAKV